jgi:hypothetical protein
MEKNMSRMLFLGSVHFALVMFSSSSCQAQEGDNISRPATLAEIRDAIDWSKIPKPDGALPGRNGLSTCSYKAPGTFLEVAAFFRKQLPVLGWKEDTTPIPGVDQKEYLYLSFDKGGMRLSVNGYRSEPSAPMVITLSNGGNVDLRTFRKPADAKFRSNSRLAAFFTTAARPEDAADYCRKAIVEKGWHEVPADSAKFFAKEGRIVLRFLQNAMEIGVVASRNGANETEVTLTSQVRYRLPASEVRETLTPKEIPGPASEKEYLAVLDLRNFPLMKDAKKRERQAEPIARANAITCQAPGTLEAAIDFHRKELSDRGWKETRAETEIDGRAEMHYEKQGYLVTVGVGKNKQEDVQISVVNHGNVDLRQLPYPPGTEIAPERGSSLNCTTPVSESDAVTFYQQELKKLGWTEVKARGRSNYQFLQYASFLRIEIQKDTEGRTAINLSSGLFVAE